jgi:hypothetical protein
MRAGERVKSREERAMFFYTLAISWENSAKNGNINNFA